PPRSCRAFHPKTIDLATRAAPRDRKGRRRKAASCRGRTEIDRSESILSQNFIHRFSPCQLINQFIQVANFSHDWLLYVLHSDTANHALDQGSRGIDFGSVCKKCLKVGLFLQLSFELLLTVSRQPRDDLIDLCFCTTLLLYFRNVEGINACEARRINSVFCHQFLLPELPCQLNCCRPPTSTRPLAAKAGDQ